MPYPAKGERKDKKETKDIYNSSFILQDEIKS